MTVTSASIKAGQIMFSVETDGTVDMYFRGSDDSSMFRLSKLSTYDVLMISEAAERAYNMSFDATKRYERGQNGR